jgi:multidrug efflux pump subunit AcrB
MFKAESHPKPKATRDGVASAFTPVLGITVLGITVFGIIALGGRITGTLEREACAFAIGYRADSQFT